jgi:predicted nucleotidyltransferase
MRTYIEGIREKILPVFKRYNVVKAAIFGSFARGEMEESSDIDILVELGGEKSLLDLSGLKIELEESLGRKVDVLTYNSLHPLIKERILSEQKMIL